MKKKFGIAIPEQKAIALSDINLAPYNPRVMPEEMMAALKASLVKHGLVLNLVIQKKGMVLIGGHQRVHAMRALCAEQGWAEPATIPSVVLEVDDATARQLNVALNKIDGEFDPYKLGELFATIREEMSAEDILATGFASENIEELIRMVAPVEDEAARLVQEAEDIPLFANAVTLTVEFATVEDRTTAKDLLGVMSTKMAQKPGTVVLEALQSMKLVEAAA